jgi:MoxR-like ATPase
MLAGKSDENPHLLRMQDASSISLAIDQISQVVRDKEDVIKLLLVGFLARGHILIEDVPGVGKTTISRCLARVLGGHFSRIQLTSDLLPVDIIGGQIINPDTNSLEFSPGPLFANIVLADELNRATPRTQSRLLEAMAERSVTVDGHSHALAEPFMVIATQNPTEHHGVYPLPESQLDRFLIRTAIGYPGAESETELILGKKAADDKSLIGALKPLWTEEQLRTMFENVEQVGIHPDVAAYIQTIIQSTRENKDLMSGVSTRGVLGFARALRARAYVENRGFVTPDDVRTLFLPVCAHRVVLQAVQRSHRVEAEAILQEIISRVSVPV